MVLTLSRRPRPLLLPALVLALAPLALLIATAASAQAKSLVLEDAASDMVAVELGQQGDSSDSLREPSESDADILSARIKHGKKSLGVLVRYTDLRRQGEHRGALLRLLTNEGRRFDAVVQAYPGAWKGRMQVLDHNQPVSCKVHHRISYGHNTLLMKIARSCIDAPAWVRVGVGSYWVEQSVAHFDDAQHVSQVTDELRLSPRIRRG